MKEYFKGMEKRRYMGECKTLLKEGLKIIWILYVLASMIFLIFKVDQMLSRDYNEVSRHIELDDNWELNRNGILYQNASLKDFRLEAVQKRDKITMQRNNTKTIKNITM